jgi:hypothetical protein
VDISTGDDFEAMTLIDLSSVCGGILVSGASLLRGLEAATGAALEPLGIGTVEAATAATFASLFAFTAMLGTCAAGEGTLTVTEAFPPAVEVFSVVGMGDGGIGTGIAMVGSTVDTAVISELLSLSFLSSFVGFVGDTADVLGDWS